MARFKTKKQVNEQGERLFKYAMDEIRFCRAVLGTTNQHEAADKVCNRWNNALRHYGHIK